MGMSWKSFGSDDMISGPPWSQCCLDQTSSCFTHIANMSHLNYSMIWQISWVSCHTPMSKCAGAFQSHQELASSESASHLLHSTAENSRLLAIQASLNSFSNKDSTLIPHQILACVNHKRHDCSIFHVLLRARFQTQSPSPPRSGVVVSPGPDMPPMSMPDVSLEGISAELTG